MPPRARLFAAVAASVCVITATVGVWAAESFEFAGLNARTTIEEAKRRYLRSEILGRHVYVSEADSHDHIYAIGLAEPGAAPRRINIYFERRRADRNEYPRCEAVAAQIRKKYGEPTTVQEFSEERSRNRRLIWRRADEDLSLLCFRMGRQRLLASDITITSDR